MTDNWSVSLVKVEEKFGLFSGGFFAFDGFSLRIRFDGVETVRLDVLGTLFEFDGISSRVDGDGLDSVGKLVVLGWTVPELAHIDLDG